MNIFDKNISFQETNNYIETNYPGYTFYNFVVLIFYNDINLFEIFNFFNNLKIKKTLFRLTIFTDRKNIGKLLNKKIYRNIFISKPTPKLTFYEKNLIDLNLLYFEKVVLFNTIYDLNNLEPKIYLTENLKIIPANLFIEIPFYFDKSGEYHQDFNKITLNYFNKKYNIPKNLSLIENKLFMIKDYNKLLEIINHNLETTNNHQKYCFSLIKKISTIILLGKEELLDEKLLNVLNVINDKDLLIRIYLLIEKTNFNDIKRNLLNKLLDAEKGKVNENEKEKEKENEKEKEKEKDTYLIFLLKNISILQNQEGFLKLLKSIKSNLPLLLEKVDKNNFMISLINNLIYNYQNEEIFNLFNEIASVMIDINNFSNIDKIINFYKNQIENKKVILNYLLVLITHFEPFYKTENDFIKIKNRMIINLDLCHYKIDSTIDLKDINMFPVNNFFLSYNGISCLNIYKKKCQINRKLCPELNFKVEKKIVKKDRLKVLFHSGFLNRKHSVYKDRHLIIKGLSEKRNFDIYFSTFDDLMLDVRFSFGKAKHIKLNRNLVEIKECLIKEDFDIIVYCEIGMDATSYYMAHLRLAPIQCNTWGHSDSCGIDTIDYFFSSKLYDEEQSENYSEKLILQNSLCTSYENPMLRYNINNFKNRYQLGFTKDTIIYFCAQSLFKLIPTFDKFIINILNRVPNSIILLLDNENKDKFMERFEGKNVANRFKFIPFMQHFDFMNYIYISNVVLDVYPFGGCNSSLEAFSLGKVIVTLPGLLINSRFTAGFYKKMGLSYLICKNEKEYIDLSIELGLIESTRFKIEKLIKEKNNILFNDKESIIEWEKDLFRIYVQKML